MEEQVNYEQVEVNNPIVQETLPNAAGVLALGILSIVSAVCCCGFLFPLSLALGIIGWVMGNKGLSLYKEAPESYTRSSYSNLNAGRICSIIGVVLSILLIVYLYVSISSMGGWDAYMEEMQTAIEKVKEAQ